MKLALAALLLLSPSAIEAAEAVRIGVLGLFHPTDLIVEAPGGLRLDGTPLDRRGPVAVELHDGALLAHDSPAPRTGALLEASGPFVLHVPEKLERHFSGELRLSADGDELRAVVEIPLETAVAAVLATEAAWQGMPAALQAQAIVSRSYYAAGARHEGFEFCDTTHCQWMGSATEPKSAYTVAAEATRGLLLQAAGRPVQALFTRSCGGRTRTLAEIGLTPDGYPFHAVECDFCRRRPVTWEREAALDDARELLEAPGLEASRLAVVRRLGWSAVPSNVYELVRGADRLHINGRGHGHGAGLCQAGAADLARRGAAGAAILRHYFPNAAVSRASRSDILVRPEPDRNVRPYFTAQP